MKFNILFFVSLVAILTLFESSVSARPSPRRYSELPELYTRNGDALGLEPSYDMLFRRSKITLVTAALRKAMSWATSKSGKGAAKGAVDAAKRASSQAAANAKSAARRQAGRNKFGPAAARHRATTNLPGRNQEFKVPGGSGEEFPIGDTTNKGPARVITQQTRPGHTKFKGVVAHEEAEEVEPSYVLLIL
jgi:hypothetical protein